MDARPQPAHSGVSNIRQTGPGDHAVEAFAKTPSGKATLVRLLLDRAERLPPAQRNWTEIDSPLKELARIEWEPLTVLLLQAQTLAAKGEFGEALELGKKLLSADRKQIVPWLFLLALAERQQSVPKEKRSGKSPEAILTAAERNLAPALNYRWHVLGNGSEHNQRHAKKCPTPSWNSTASKARIASGSLPLFSSIFGIRRTSAGRSASGPSLPRSSPITSERGVPSWTTFSKRRTWDGCKADSQ